MFLSKKTEKKKINVNNNLGISVNWNADDNANGMQLEEVFLFS